MQIRPRAKSTRSKRGINARYARVDGRIAITASNFARNFAVIQFGHDLLGVKPNSKAAANQQPADSTRFTLSSLFLCLDFLCYALNEPFTLLLPYGHRSGEAGKISENNLAATGHSSVCYNTTRFTRDAFGETDVSSNFKETKKRGRNDVKFIYGNQIIC